ncbi:MAG: hypothetical protein EXS16_20710 [Gemmataceae bacterium]|nr:hypothetical protein [Gemmataceae bacterium]
MSKATDSGQPARLGTLDFDEANRATLSLEDSGPAGVELQKGWEEISIMEELTWKQSRPDVIDGEKVMRIVGEKVKPGDATYIFAVLNTLERKHGYMVDMESR